MSHSGDDWEDFGFLHSDDTPAAPVTAVVDVPKEKAPPTKIEVTALSARVQLYNADCLTVMQSLPAECAHSMVCDPPGGISFMGKNWDKSKGGREIWIAWAEGRFREAYRLLRPGAYGLVWAMPRTSHWTATALEDSGFEIFECITHIHGQGFPKNYDVSKGVETFLKYGTASWNAFKKLQGERKPQSSETVYGMTKTNAEQGNRPTAYKAEGAFDLVPETEEAKLWDGYGTAIRPLSEHWWFVRKPRREKNTPAQVLATGTGALNLAGCRVVGSDKDRWPPNVLLSHHYQCISVEDNTWECVEDCPVSQLREQGANTDAFPQFAAPYHYFSKPSPKEKNVGCEGLPERQKIYNGQSQGSSEDMKDLEKRFTTGARSNYHPTVKSLGLMKWLVRISTPQDGTCLDPFMGSGTTGVAAILEGKGFIGMENDRKEGYFPIATARITQAIEDPADITTPQKVKKPAGQLAGQGELFSE